MTVVRAVTSAHLPDTPVLVDHMTMKLFTSVGIRHIGHCRDIPLHRRHHVCPLFCIQKEYGREGNLKLVTSNSTLESHQNHGSGCEKLMQIIVSY